MIPIEVIQRKLPGEILININDEMIDERHDQALLLNYKTQLRTRFC